MKEGRFYGIYHDFTTTVQHRRLEYLVSLSYPAQSLLDLDPGQDPAEIPNALPKCQLGKGILGEQAPAGKTQRRDVAPASWSGASVESEMILAAPLMSELNAHAHQQKLHQARDRLRGAAFPTNRMICRN